MASAVTSAIAGVHPANIYVYCCVDDFVGSAGLAMLAAGVPYSYSVAAFNTVVPSSSTKVTVYLFTVAL